VIGEHQATAEPAPAVAAFFDAVLNGDPLPDTFLASGGNFAGDAVAAGSFVTVYAPSGQVNALVPPDTPTGPASPTFGAVRLSTRVARIPVSLPPS